METELYIKACTLSQDATTTCALTKTATIASRPFLISLTFSSAKASGSSARPRGSNGPPGYRLSSLSKMSESNLPTPGEYPLGPLPCCLQFHSQSANASDRRGHQQTDAHLRNKQAKLHGCICPCGYMRQSSSARDALDLVR